MNARLTSWGVPAVSFALAAILSVVSTAEGRPAVRAAAAATGACVCDLKNKLTAVTVNAGDVKTVTLYDLHAGIPGTESITWIENYAGVILTVEYLPKKGAAPITIPFPVEMDKKEIKPKVTNVPALGVKLTTDLGFEGSLSKKRLDDAIKTAKGKLGAKVVGETPNSRSPLIVRTAATAVTREKLGDVVCEDEIVLAVSTNVDLLGSGTGSGTTPN